MTVMLFLSQLQNPLEKLVCKILPTLYEIGSAERNKYILQDSDFFHINLALFDYVLCKKFIKLLKCKNSS